MSQLIVFLLASLHFAVARAAEIQDAPIPEPNYIGIAIFLAICIGCGWWFFKAVMKNSSTTIPVSPKLFDKAKH